MPSVASSRDPRPAARSGSARAARSRGPEAGAERLVVQGLEPRPGFLGEAVDPLAQELARGLGLVARHGHALPHLLDVAREADALVLGDRTVDLRVDLAELLRLRGAQRVEALAHDAEGGGGEVVGSLALAQPLAHELLHGSSRQLRHLA